MVALVNRAGTMVLPFLSLYLTLHLGFSTLDAGRLLSLFGFGSMAGSYVGGLLSDRLGPYRVLCLSLFAGGAGFVVLAGLETMAAIGVAIFFVSLISDAFRPALMAAVAETSSPKERPRAFALIRMAVNLGMAIGPAAGGFLAAHHYSWLFFADAATCWAAGLLLWAVVARGASFGDDSDRISVPVRASRIRSPWRDLPFLGFLVLIFALGVVFFQVWITFPVFLRDVHQLGERWIGSLLAVNALLIVAFEMPLLHALEGYRELRVAAVGSLFVCLGLATLPLGHGFTIALLAMTILTIGEMLSLPMSNSFVARRAGEGATGRYMGAYTLAFSASFVVAPSLGMTIYDRWGGAVLWYGIGGLGVILMAGFIVLSQRLGPQNS
ncbi:MAG: MFS transporter [bacterium]|nr:MFS transporter [bacterium]